MSPHETEQPVEMMVGNARVRCADVTMVVGEGGVSLDGGEMVRWAHTVVVTDKGRYRVSGMSSYNATCYEEFLRQCPQAVGIPYKGDLHMPNCPPDAEPVAFLAEALRRVKREVVRQARWSLATAGFFALITVGSLALDLILLGAGIRPWKLWLVPLVALVIFFLQLARALSQMGRNRKVMETLRALQV